MIDPYTVGPNDDPDIIFGALTFYRKKNPDGLAPVIVDAGDGMRAIRLAVQTGAYVGPLDDPADAANDRCELREVKSPLGTEVWYGFSIRVPREFPKKPLRFVAAQFKMPYDFAQDGSPAFALRIHDGHWLATIEHLYEEKDRRFGRYLSLPIDGTCGLHAVPAFDHHNFNPDQGPVDLQVRAIMATDADGVPAHLLQDEFCACTTGVEVKAHSALPKLDHDWTNFVLHFAPSGLKDVDGLFELFANGNLVAQAWGEFGFPDVKEAKQYFKIGPYRNNDPLWGDDIASIEVKNVRRGLTRTDIDEPAQVAFR
jgi:hypothetical protein